VSILAVAVTGRGLVAPDEPVIRADDEGLLRGRAAFETLRVYSELPFRLPEHVQRLEASAERIGLPELPRDELTGLASLVLPRACGGDAVLRLVWTGGSVDGPPTGIALLSEVPPWIEEVRTRGARAVSLLGVRAAAPWLLPGVKSPSYAVHMAADAEAKRRGADEAIFVDAAGVVLEGTVTNVWWRVGRTLYTPSLDLGILAGVTRAALVEVGADAGYAVEEGTFPLGALLEAEEAFTSSSVREVMPVVELDGRTLRRGPAADELQPALRRLAAAAGESPSRATAP
jgi:branched-subunit amino acid aminotransferase/4-amino-4-deoxychorismate lyase